MQDDEEPLLRVLKIAALISEFIASLLGLGIVLSIIWTIFEKLL